MQIDAHRASFYFKQLLSETNFHAILFYHQFRYLAKGMPSKSRIEQVINDIAELGLEAQQDETIVDLMAKKLSHMDGSDSELEGPKRDPQRLMIAHMLEEQIPIGFLLTKQLTEALVALDFGEVKPIFEPIVSGRINVGWAAAQYQLLGLVSVRVLQGKGFTVKKAQELVAKSFSVDNSDGRKRLENWRLRDLKPYFTKDYIDYMEGLGRELGEFGYPIEGKESDIDDWRFEMVDKRGTDEWEKFQITLGIAEFLRTGGETLKIMGQRYRDIFSGNSVPMPLLIQKPPSNRTAS